MSVSNRRNSAGSKGGDRGSRGLRFGRALPVVAAAVLATLGHVSQTRAQSNVFYFLDNNGSTADFGITAGSVYTWNGTTPLFNPTNVGTGTIVFNDLVQNPVTGGASSLALTSANPNGSYTLEISGNRWLQRIDGNANNGTSLITGAGTSPTLNIVSGGNNFFVGAQGTATTLTFDPTLTVNAYGPLGQFSAGSGRTLNLFATFNRIDRGIFQANVGTAGGVFVAASNTSVVNTNGLVLNGLYGAAEVNVTGSGNVLTNFASRSGSDQLIAASLTPVTAANLTQLTDATANYSLNLGVTNTYTLVSGTSNTANAVYGITLTGDRQANAVRFANLSAFSSGTNLFTGDTGGYSVDLAGSKFNVNSILVAQHPLTVTNTGASTAALSANGSNDLTIIAGRNVVLNVPVTDASPGSANTLVLMGTRGGQVFTLGASNGFTGNLYVGNGTALLANASSAGGGTEVVLNQATLRPLAAMTLAQGVRTSATTVNVFDGTNVTNAIGAASLTLGLSSRLTLQNGQFTVPGAVTFGSVVGSGQANQLTVANLSSLSISGGLSGNGQLFFGGGTSGFNSTVNNLVSGPSTGWVGSIQARNGTTTVDGSVTSGTLTAIGQNSGRFVINGNLTVQQQSFSDIIFGEQSGTNVAITDIGGSVSILGTTGTKRPVALANGAGTNDSTITVNLTGSLSLNDAVGDVGIGGNPFRSNRNSTAVMNINSGGTFSVAGAATLPRIWVGANSNISGGTALSNISGAQSGTIVVNTGGVLITSRTLSTGTAGTGTGAGPNGISGVLTLNGGTLRAFTGQTNTAWVNGLTRLGITDLGGNIDTNGNAMTIPQAIVNEPGSTAGGITKVGGGTLTLTATNTFGGSVTANAGAVSVPFDAALGGAVANQVVNLGGGTLQLQGGFGATFARPLNATAGTSVLDVTSNIIAYTGNLTGTGNIVFTAPAGQLTLPNVSTSGFNGEYTLRSGTFELPNSYGLTKKVVFGQQAGSNAVVNLSGSLTSGSTTTTSIFAVGDQASSAVLNVTGNVSFFNSDVFSGTTTLLIGTANLAAQTTVATLNVTGAGTLTYAGGIVEVGGSRNFSNGTTTGSLNISGNALVDFQAGGGVFVGNRASTTGTSTGSINLTGGTLRTARTIQQGLNGGTGTLNLDGGVLQAGADNVNMAGAITTQIGNGGAILDDNGFASVSVSADLTPAPGSTGGLIKKGAGTLSMSGSLSIPGGVLVEQGRLRVTQPLVLTAAAPANAVIVDPASTLDVAVTGYQPLASKVAFQSSSLLVDSGARVNVFAVDRSIAGNQGVAILTGVDLTATGPSAYGGTIDLGNNDAIVRGHSLATVRDWAKAGLAGNGGITASAADAYTGLAVRSPMSAFGFQDIATFDGISVGASDVLVKFTYLGDTDLNGTLDARDFNAVLNGYSNGLGGWENGDVNYDGVVNSTDWGLFLAAYSNVTLTYGDATEGGSGAPIPEPSTLGLLAAALPLATRRRRR